MKKVILFMLAVICIAALVACNQNPATGGTNPEATLPTAERQYANNLNANGYIGEEAAKEIALNHAGLTVAEVTFIKGEQDNEDGTVIYEIEFYRDGTEYDYEINAADGSVIQFDSDAEAQTLPSEPQNFITLDEAKAIALSHAGLVETDVDFIKGELDIDDGKAEYEIEFYRGNAEFDYEIDAISGDIAGYDYEVEAELPPQSPAAGTSTVITPEEAKAIALQHAGLAEADVTRLKVKTDRDDGMTVYEIEFKKGFTEYEYEINAADGTIIEYEAD